jgi:hypothetical protein
VRHLNSSRLGCDCSTEKTNISAAGHGLHHALRRSAKVRAKFSGVEMIEIEFRRRARLRRCNRNRKGESSALAAR